METFVTWVKNNIQGVFLGGAAVAIIGFGWADWTTASSAKEMAMQQAQAAVTEVLAPICVKNFLAQDDQAKAMTEFMEVSSWQRDAWITNGGWATMPGMERPERGVADACAKLLSSR